MASRLSPYQELRRNGQLLNVQEGETRIWLPSSKKKAIGTTGLNACQCVIILGRAIIMAHISILPGRFSQLQISNEDHSAKSREHRQEMLAQISRLLRDNRQYFPPSTTACGIYGDSAKDTMQHIYHEVQNTIRKMGYNLKGEFYEEVDTLAETTSPKGEVLSFIRGGQAFLYLERTRLWPTNAPPSQNASHQSQPSSSRQAQSGNGSNRDDGSSKVDEGNDDDDEDHDEDDDEDDYAGN